VEDKRMLRASVLRARGHRSAAERARAGAGLAEHGLAAAAGCPAVAAHAAVVSEPPTRPLLEALQAAGVRVLLPRVHGHDLAWGELTAWGDLERNHLGLLEPASTTREAAEAAGGAALILVPALAVDRAGHRLGRGGGFYDRWLPAAPRGRVLAVVYDDELLDDVPHEPHDRTVDGALTPSGLVALGQ
jgi:5-formyltetrahydrofolate cyclo-ligase